jgi:hypothetical protein
MMPDRATAAEWIRDAAASRWDAALADRGGFTRPASSATYTRKISDAGRQRIHLDLIVRPPYGPDSFHLSPRGSIAFPELAKIGAEMLGPHASGYGKSGTVAVVPLELIAPDSPMILFASAEELKRFAPDIEKYLVDAMVPYLDQRASVAALTAAYSREWAASGAAPGDIGRLPVFVAAGHLAIGDAQQALRTLETAYPEGTRAREHYADAFAVVEAAVRKVV